MPITFAGYTQSEALTDFPALIVIKPMSTGHGLSYSEFQSPPYNDLRFTAEDQSTLLDFEIEHWDTSGESFVWVRVPALTSDT
ncbi:MAG: DUF2341 domain-containing protein [Lentisphaerae bacterium]|nr:DUF2341 domain-containing protein [Lentisphaerota bacterium]